VESVRAITPVGVWESRRLPGSGAGISPDRVLIGSERILGVITEAWVRARERPGHRASVCGEGSVTCRFTHVYPDGPAPYFTIVAPVRRGAELDQWAAIKQVASDVVIDGGGTITHHHAVGRDHRPWYDRQRQQPFAEALRAAKAAVDPTGALNPGVLIDA
jgi:FAD/FMN-containing dehydrogenase